ncbi:MAG: beta-galactosidase [Armatimonadota bacterium]
MGSSSIVGDRLHINGAPLYIRGAEIHYFRLPADSWRDRLAKARAGGMNLVSSYMPWYWHEPAEGAIDLIGRTQPERSLRRFLDLAAELGLYVIARPGPFVNSELRCGGFPEWLFRDHPETLSHRAEGQIAPGRPLPAEGEPLYRQYVRAWYDQVAPLIAEYDIHRGGPVILFQPDNELSANWSYGLLNSLYDPTILTEFWPNWLRDTYGELAVVAERHQRSYGSFAEVKPPRAFPQHPAEKLLCIDWMNFKRWFFADWGATMAQWAIEDGVLAPMVFNEPVAGFYGHGDHSGFGAVLRARGVQGCTACHTYAGNGLFNLETSLGAAMGIEITKSSPWGGPPLAVEVNTDWFIPRLSGTQLNWSPLMRLGLGRGLMGSVIYTYSAGIVSLDETIDGPEYYAASGLDLQGNPTEGFRQLLRFNRFIEGWQDTLVAAQSPVDITLGYAPSQRLLDFLGTQPLLQQQVSGQGPGGERFTDEPGLDRSAGVSHDWVDGYEGVSKQTVPAEAGIWKKAKEACLLFTRMNLAYNLRDLTNPNVQPGQGWIAVPCTGGLDAVAIDYLVAHLDQGGGCLFFPTFPVYTLDGVPDLRIAERLGVKLAGQVRPAGGELIDYGTRLLDLPDGDRVGVDGWIYTYELSDGSETLASYGERPVIAKAPAGRGAAVVAGIDPVYTTLSTLRLWRLVIENAMGLQPAVRMEGTYCHALLRQSPSGSVLTLLNLAGQVGETTVHLRDEQLTFTLELAPHEARCLLLGVQLGEARLIYATSELIPLSPDRRRLELHGAPGTPGELAFAHPVVGLLDGQPVAGEISGEYHVIRYRHGLAPMVFEFGGQG